MTARVEAPLDRLTFDTTALPPAEAFDRYRDLYGAGADVVQTGPDFRVKIDAWRLDRMLLYDRWLNDVGHRRDATRTRSDGMSHFTVTLLLAGDLEIAFEDRLHRPRPGEVVIVDTQIPISNRMQHAHIATLSIARERLAAIAGDAGDLHGLTLTAGAARLFREFVESLLRNLPTMSDTTTATASGVLAALLTIAIDNSGAQRSAASSSRDLERLTRFRRQVDARIADPDFDVADAIRESGMSRATLYRLLTAEGGVAALIRNRRLEQVRNRLSDPHETRPLTEIVEAAGFASVSHASHAFFDRYTIRPSDYRDVVRARTGSDAFFKMRFWQEEVR